MQNMLGMLGNFRKIVQRERYSPAKMQAWQASFFPELVVNAYDRVPFYKEFYRGFTRRDLLEIRTPQDLARLPSIDRNFYRNYPASERLAATYTRENTRRVTTSGTSGLVLETFNTPADLFYLRMVYFNDLWQAGLRPWDRAVLFRVAPFVHHPFERLGLMPFQHVQTSRPLEEQLEIFLRAKPTFLTGFPSVMYALMEEMKRQGIRYKKVRNILCGGEKMSQAVRQALADFYGAKIYEVYGAVETFTMARECAKGSLHVHSSDVIVEVENGQGQASLNEGEGQAVVTRLFAQAMPLIRYRVGDWIKLSPNDCSCGTYQTPLIKKIYGRSDDMLLTPRGQLLNGIFLTNFIEGYPEIKQYQVVQTAHEIITVKLVLENQGSAAENLQAKLKEKLAAVYPDFTYQMELTENIPLGPNGKIKVIKSEVGVTL